MVADEVEVRSLALRRGPPQHTMCLSSTTGLTGAPLLREADSKNGYATAEPWYVPGCAGSSIYGGLFKTTDRGMTYTELLRSRLTGCARSRSRHQSPRAR